MLNLAGRELSYGELPGERSALADVPHCTQCQLLSRTIRWAMQLTANASGFPANSGAAHCTTYQLYEFLSRIGA